ncbi:MAG TPA: hypothetical protein VFV28_02670 [Limnobacter sp.]|nr:hypothetical protein [Limnobacter sp.]
MLLRMGRLFRIHAAALGLLLGVDAQAGQADRLQLAAISADFQIVEELAASSENISHVQRVTQDVARKLAPLFDLPVKVVVTERKEASPMLSTLTRQGECLVIVNRNEQAWPQWEPFLTHGVITLEELYEFAALHEIAHCFNKLGPDANYMDFLKPGRPSESFSDIFALSMMSDVREDFEMKRIVDAVIEIRASYNPLLYYTHNTAGNLRKVYDLLVYKTPVYKNVYLLAAHAVKLSKMID